MPTSFEFWTNGYEIKSISTKQSCTLLCYKVQNAFRGPRHAYNNYVEIYGYYTGTYRRRFYVYKQIIVNCKQIVFFFFFTCLWYINVKSLLGNKNRLLFFNLPPSLFQQKFQFLCVHSSTRSIYIVFDK